MQKPNSEGFVNVVWPSTNVPHGGIFHIRKAEPTTEQQQFLKVLLDESRFNLKLRANQAFGLRSSDEGQAPPSATITRPQTTTVRPRTSRRRSLSAIQSSGVLDIDTFRPTKRGEDRERMKEKLANTMAYGDSPDQQPPPPPRLLLQKPVPKLPTNKETWNEIVTQIRERAEWLAEMEYLGHAAPHREIVQEQIAERMRALDALGLDSVCSSARSTARSTVRSLVHSTVQSPRQSKARSPKRTRSRDEARLSAYSKETAKKPPGLYISSGGKSKKLEENVMAYNYAQLSPLRYSPRRRV